jgi:hypothetical protein
VAAVHRRGQGRDVRIELRDDPAAGQLYSTGVPAPRASPFLFTGTEPRGPRRVQVSSPEETGCIRVLPRGARRPVQLPLSPGTGLVRTFHAHGYGQHPQLAFLAIPEWPPVFSFLLRSGAVVILTSASRSGGEVRITEAERPRHVTPGRRRCRTGIAAHSCPASAYPVIRPVCGHCLGIEAREPRSTRN